MNDFDLSNPDKVPFGKMPQWAQWAIRGAVADGATVEYFAQGKWHTGSPVRTPLPNVAYRVRPDPVREVVTYDAFVWESFTGEFAMSPPPIIEEGTKGTATLTLEDGKPVEMTWKADQ